MDSFNDDLRNSNLRSDAELPAIIDQYEKTLKETLEKHAPLKKELLRFDYERLGITRKSVKPKKSVGDPTVVGNHIDYVSVERCVLNSVRL